MSLPITQARVNSLLTTDKMKAQILRSERELAGMGFTTLEPDGWDFQSFYGDTVEENGHEYHLCLSSRTAQYAFALDRDQRVVNTCSLLASTRGV